MKLNSFVLSLVLIFFSPVAHALYEWSDDSSNGTARLLLRGFIISSEQKNADASQNQSNTAAGGLARLVFETRSSSLFSYEVNAYQTLIDNSLVKHQNNLSSGFGVERSDGLEWSQSDNEYAHFAFDRLNVRIAGDKSNIVIGRQAINLATTFFFSPNDFFAPFTSQSFYRVYKAGVDGLRAEYAVSELSSLSIMAVLGYEVDNNTDTGWSESPDDSRHSYLARYLVNAVGFEWGIIVGKVRRSDVKGLSISGELFGWLGLRLEGHRSLELDHPNHDYSQYTIGIEHRWSNSLFIQFEQFYNGKGALAVSDYDLNRPYLARRYQAFGLNYELTPLWVTQLSLLYNQIDYSKLYSANFVYSLSDESELSFGVSISDGSSSTGTGIQSEYGSYPNIFNLELRSYF